MISQPVLSKHIAALEQELGINLIDRNSTPLSLTVYGLYFQRQVTKIIAQYD